MRPKVHVLSCLDGGTLVSGLEFKFPCGLSGSNLRKEDWRQRAEACRNQLDKASMRNTSFAPGFLRMKRKDSSLLYVQQLHASTQSVVGSPL